MWWLFRIVPSTLDDYKKINWSDRECKMVDIVSSSRVIIPILFCANNDLTFKWKNKTNSNPKSLTIHLKICYIIATRDFFLIS